MTNDNLINFGLSVLTEQISSDLLSENIRHDMEFDIEALQFWLSSETRVKMAKKYPNLIVDNKNLANAVRSGYRSNDIDNIVFLGILGDPNPRNLIKPIKRLSTIDNEFWGSYQPGADRISVNFNIERYNIRLGNILVHELKHRAFTIISSTPSLRSLMPSLLLTGKTESGISIPNAENGWGRKKNYRIWNEKAPNGGTINPEHAMIYASQTTRLDKQFYTKSLMVYPNSESKTLQFWRKVYDDVDKAVGQWLSNNIGMRKTGGRGRGRQSAYEVKIANGIAQNPNIKSKLDDIIKVAYDPKTHTPASSTAVSTTPPLPIPSDLPIPKRRSDPVPIPADLPIPKERPQQSSKNTPPKTTTPPPTPPKTTTTPPTPPKTTTPNVTKVTVAPNVSKKKNSRSLLPIGLAIALVLGGIYGYNKFISPALKRRSERLMREKRTKMLVQRYLEINRVKLQNAKLSKTLAIKYANELQRQTN